MRHDHHVDVFVQLFFVFSVIALFISLQGVCRDILCQGNRQMQTGICVYPEKAKRDCSYSIFLKLTPVGGMLSLVEITSISYDNVLYHTLVQNIEALVDFQVYGESDASDMFGYIVVYLVIKTEIDEIQLFLLNWRKPI